MSLMTLTFSAAVFAPLVLLVVDLLGRRPEGPRPAPVRGARR